MQNLIRMKSTNILDKKEKTKIFNSFQNVYIALATPVWFTVFLTDDERIFYLSKVISQFALCAFLYARVEEEESHFSFMGLMALTADFISEGFAVYNNEIASELFALISAFFFTACMAANIFDKWGYKKSWSEFFLLCFASCCVLVIQFLVQLDVETKSRFWTTNPCIYSLGFMVIFQLWRHQKTSNSSYVMGLIGTLIHVISYDIKFIFLGYWSPLLVKFIGLGELLSNYFMTMSIDDHMIWRRRYTDTRFKKKSDQIKVRYDTVEDIVRDAFERR